MKLDRLIENESTENYSTLLKRFMQEYKSPALYTSDGVIRTDSPLTYVGINGDDDITNDLIDENGIFKLKFGHYEGVLHLIGLDKLKSLRNFPKFVGKEFTLTDLKNITSFDLDLNHVYNLYINNCSFSDLTNIKNVERLFTCTNLKNITSFDNLPKLKHSVMYRLVNMNVNNKIQNNSSIAKLQLDVIYGLENFMNMPKDLFMLECENLQDLTSFTGIDTCSDLTNFRIKTNVYNNIISILYCDKLWDFNISHKIINTIFRKYINDKIKVSDKKNYIMDCAVELIDAGFPEAAEL